MRIKKILIFFIPVLLIFFYWKNIILNPSTHLYDWHDVPFVIWVIQNNIRHFANLDLNLLYETNAMYPFPLSLSFTEHMFFPSYINFVISWFAKGQIAQFNILLILNHLFIYFSSYLLAGRFSKNIWVKVIFGFFMAFSPYVFSQIGHFQMLFFWPLIFSLYFFFSPKKEMKHHVLIGFLLGLQFLSSVYVGIMGLFMYMLYFVVQGLLDFKRENLIGILKEFCVIIITFLVISSPSIYGYISMQQLYHPSYEQGQYVNYSAHITDYLLITFNDSVLNKYLFQPIIGVFNQHKSGEMAGFMGIVPLIIIGYWLTSYIKGNSRMDSPFGRKPSLRGNDRAVSSSSGLTRGPILKLWLILLVLFSFIFSLGPRMNLNGKYLVTPLPYMFILKYIPFAGIMRALARWYFVIIFSIGILTVFGLDRIQKNLSNKLLKRWILPIIFILFFFELYPLTAQVSKGMWWTPAYTKIKQVCEKNPGAMLEYPFEYRASDKDVLKNLSYKTGILLSSMEHDCEILSGFSAYEPKKFLEYQKFFQDRNFDRSTMKLLNDLKFKYVKFNLSSMNNDDKKQISWFVTTEYVDKLYIDKSNILVQVKKVKPLPKLIK